MSSQNKPETVTAAELPLSMGVEYVASQTGLSKSGVWNHIRAGNLRAIKLGARVVVTRDALLEFLSHSSEIPGKVKRDPAREGQSHGRET